MDLFHKGEAKESLTEHLYTIIHQNEVDFVNYIAALLNILSVKKLSVVA